MTKIPLKPKNWPKYSRNLKNDQNTHVLGSYFYVIGISYDKMHFTYICVNSSRSKMIITSDYTENMEITQEPLKKS